MAASPVTMHPSVRPLFIAALACLIAGIAWVAYDAVVTSDRAERTLHACIFTTKLLEEYVVATNGNWPKSWEDLRTTITSAEATPMYSWPDDHSALERRVEVDFSARPAMLAKCSVENFDAIKPIGPCYTTYDRHFSFLLDALRRYHH